MSRGAIKEQEIAQRYGGVLFDLAREDKVLSKLVKEVKSLLTWLSQNEKVWGQVVSPIVSLPLQQQVIAKLISSFKFVSILGRFLHILCENRRLSNLPSILENVVARSEAAEGKLEGQLETATKISQKEVSEIEVAFQKALGKKVSFEQVINENLLAGIVIHLESWKIDASLKSTLNQLNLAMKG